MKAKKASKAKPSGSPQIIDNHNWYYEKPGSILFIHEVYEMDRHVRTDNVSIPWRKLMASAKRCGRKLP